jgi:hypothetical protein
MIFLTGFPEPFHYSLTIYEIIAYYMLYMNIGKREDEHDKNKYSQGVTGS